MAIDAGADGVVVGALTESRTLDEAALSAMRQAVGNKQLILHRAFGLCQRSCGGYRSVGRVRLQPHLD